MEQSTQSSDAGHGPSRGFSGMNKVLKDYLDQHPKHRDEQKSRSRSLGRPLSKKQVPKKVIDRQS